MKLAQIIIALGLVGIWVWVLGRPALTKIFDRSRRDPVGAFSQGMSSLSSVPTGPGARGGSRSQQAALARMNRASAQKRRLQIMLGLLVAVVVSLMLAITRGGTFVVQHLLLDVCLLSYVGLIAKAGAARNNRGTRVATRPVEAVKNPVYARTANGR